MLAKTIHFVLRYPLAALLLTALLVAAGLSVAPFRTGPGVLPGAALAVDAIPDLGDNQQIVSAEWAGRSPQDVENQITFPLTSALLGVPGVEAVRSTSMFGFASVYLVFEAGKDPYWCRTRILEKLSALPAGLLPEGVQPQLAPDATALGQVFWYTLEGRDSLGRPTGGWDLHELRRVQDFYVKYHLLGAKGVAEVASIGGFVQEYQIDVDPARLKATGLTLEEVAMAIRAANLDVGANTLEINRAEYFIRSLGYARSQSDWEQIVLRTRGATPLLLREVARVGIGPADRRGLLDKNGLEAVGGIAVARFDANPAEVTTQIRDRVDRMSAGMPYKWLPDGRRSRLTVVPFYDRGELIAETLATLHETLWLEILITVIVVLFMVRSLRASAIISAVLPLGVLLAFVAMKIFGVPANLVSLAGIAIAIGAMVDMGIIFIENCLRHLERAPAGRSRTDIILAAGKEVLPAITTSVAITVVSFLPVFVLPGMEGELFRPLAFTKTAAMLGAMVLTVVLLPVLARLLPARAAAPLRNGGEKLRTAFRANGTNDASPILPAGLGAAVLLLSIFWRPLGYGHSYLLNLIFIVLVAGLLLWAFQAIIRHYRAILNWSLEHKRLFLLAPAALLLAGLLTWSRLGREFMPPLDEGQFLLMPTYVSHAGVEENRDMLQLLDRAIARVPEVERVVGKAGRAESALDPAPLSMYEIMIRYKPEFALDSAGRRFRQWRSHIHTPDDIWNEVRGIVGQVPGLAVPPKLYPIEARRVMLQTGVRAPLAIKLSGPDQVLLDSFAADMARELRQTPGVRAESVLAERLLGKPYLEIAPDRAALSRFGLSVDAFQRFLEAALGGMALSQTVEGRERYQVRVRFPRDVRDSPDAIGSLPVQTPTGAQIPLKDLAAVRYSQGPVEIRSENGQLVHYVLFDKAAGADAGTAFANVQQRLHDRIAAGALVVPAGMSYEFTGTYRQQVEAFSRLRYTVALSFILIFGLLYLQFRSWKASLLIFSGILVALAGGFLLLWLYGQPWFLHLNLFGEDLRHLLGIRPVHLSVAVWIGFLALFGIAANDGVLMATYLQQLFRHHTPADRAEVRALVLKAGLKRIRPALMTTATALLALLPVLTGRGRGSDLMAPMAVPIFGGMLIQVITVLVVPVVWAAWEERKASGESRTVQGETVRGETVRG